MDGAHIRYFDFFCRLSVTDARIVLSSLSETARQVFVSLMMPGIRETPHSWLLCRNCLGPSIFGGGWAPVLISQGQLSVYRQELPIIQHLIFVRHCARHFHALSHLSLTTALRSRRENRHRVACQGHTSGQWWSQGPGPCVLPTRIEMSGISLQLWYES